MWKFVTRSICETLEFRICRTNIYSRSSQDENNSTEKKALLAPNFSTICNDYFIDNKHSGPKEKKHQSQYNAKFTWIDAVSWSSFLAVGLIVCQNLCINRKLFDINNKNELKWRDKFLSFYPQLQPRRYLNQHLVPRLDHVFNINYKLKETKSIPKILNDKTLKTQNVFKHFNTHLLNVNNELNESKDTESVLSGASNVTNFYGPITAQEAFDKAANEFSNTHFTIMGELELDYGSKAVEDERYEDALEHFITGTKLSSAGSMFNLALCYELGLGTSVDYEKARKYYSRAANKGHTDAMYNLGVFYAQGKGGLKRNKDIARQLFMEAAKKGQVQAIKALQLEESFKKHAERKKCSKYHFEVTTTNNNIKNNVLTKLNSYNHILTTNVDEQSESDKFINTFNECINPKNSTDLFLEVLGVHK